jgi:NitT/TauT family transport system substrate-binding protein
MRKLRRRLIAALLSLTVVAVVGCGRGGGDSSHRTIRVVTQVTYLTGFALRGQESYMYVAVEKGFFREAGLSVDIKAGAGTGENLKLLLGGKVDFAVLDLTGALIEYGGPNKTRGFTAVAAIHQSTLSCIMALDGSGISSPRDLAGRSIGYQPGGVNFTLFPVYAKLAGIDAAKVRWVTVAPAQLPTLLAAGKVDAITQLVVGKPAVQNAAKGRKPVTLPYSDYLTDPYGNALAVSTGTARERPDLVRRFRDAMLRGLTYAVDHPDEAGAIFAKHVSGYPARVAAEETALLAPYVRTVDGGPLGGIDAARVARGVALLQSGGVISGPISPDEVVSFGLTPHRD